MVHQFVLTAPGAAASAALKGTRTMAAWISIKAIRASGTANTGNVYVGDSTAAASTGYTLTPGQVAELRPIGDIQTYDLAKIFIFADNASDTVNVLYGVR